MNSRIQFLAAVAMFLAAQPSFAVQGLAIDLGARLGLTLGSILPTDLGGSLPIDVGVGGALTVATASLVIGIQLIRRKKK